MDTSHFFETYCTTKIIIPFLWPVLETDKVAPLEEMEITFKPDINWADNSRKKAMQKMQLIFQVVRYSFIHFKGLVTWKAKLILYKTSYAHYFSDLKSIHADIQHNIFYLSRVNTGCL